MPEKILIVDDDADTLRLVRIMLERQGYQVIAASDGQDALAQARAEQPDLILLDVMMPGINGLAVVRQLREDERTQDTPIIMFTAKSQLDDKLQGFEAGADDYMTKPIQSRELLARVKAVLGRSARSRREAPAEEGGSFMLAVTAPKGGLGVTTVALNLAVAIRKDTRKDVLLADFRPGQGTLGLELGYTNPDGFSQLLERQASEIDQGLVESGLILHDSGIRLLLSSSQPRDAQYAGAAGHFEALARLLPQLARFVILDLGPGLTPLNEAVLPHCNEVLVVVEPVSQTVWQAKALIQDLIGAGLRESQVHAVLVNRVRSSMQLTLSQVQEQLVRPVIPLASPDPELAFLASSHNVPLIVQQPDGLAAQQFSRLAGQIAHRSG